MDKEDPWYNREVHITFEDISRRLMEFKLFSIPLVSPLFYFVLVYLITQILWFPAGATVVLLLVVLSIPVEILGIDLSFLMNIVTGTFLFISMWLGIILPVFYISFWPVRRLNSFSRNKLSNRQLLIITALATLVSLYFFYQAMLDSWWWN